MNCFITLSLLQDVPRGWRGGGPGALVFPTQGAGSSDGRETPAGGSGPDEVLDKPEDILQGTNNKLIQDMQQFLLGIRGSW